jgi:hypothetical protein
VSPLFTYTGLGDDMFDHIADDDLLVILSARTSTVMGNRFTSCRADRIVINFLADPSRVIANTNRASTSLSYNIRHLAIIIIV